MENKRKRGTFGDRDCPRRNKWRNGKVPVVHHDRVVSDGRMDRIPYQIKPRKIATKLIRALVGSEMGVDSGIYRNQTGRRSPASNAIETLKMKAVATRTTGHPILQTVEFRRNESR